MTTLLYQQTSNMFCLSRLQLACNTEKHASHASTVAHITHHMVSSSLYRYQLATEQSFIAFTITFTDHSEPVAAAVLRTHYVIFLVNHPVLIKDKSTLCITMLAVFILILPDDHSKSKSTQTNIITVCNMPAHCSKLTGGQTDYARWWSMTKTHEL